MNCDQARARMWVEIDGELGDGEAAALRAHWQSCADCAAELRARQGVVAKLRLAPQQAADPAHVAAVLAAVAGAGSAPARRPWWLALTHLAAAAVGAWIVSAALGAGEPRGSATELSAPVGRADLASAQVASVPAPEVTVIERERLWVPLAGSHRPPARPLSIPWPIPYEVRVPVEVRVEVPVPVAGPVPAAGPSAAQRQAAAALERSSLALAQVAEQLAELRRADDGSVGPEIVAAAAADEPDEPDDDQRQTAAPLAPGRTPPVTVQRDGRSLRLSTHGATDDVVPALIALLPSAEPALQDAVQRRLLGVARDLGLQPPRGEASSADRDPWYRSDQASATALPGAEVPEGPPSAAAWREWWNAAEPLR
jgi:anti-sigma factor RsiW